MKGLKRIPASSYGRKMCGEVTLKLPHKRQHEDRETGGQTPQSEKPFEEGSKRDDGKGAKEMRRNC